MALTDDELVVASLLAYQPGPFARWEKRLRRDREP